MKTARAQAEAVNFDDLLAKNGYEKAENQGNVSAQISLGDLYLTRAIAPKYIRSKNDLIKLARPALCKDVI